ncbi:hypothetical protein DRQ36_03405 [bacterium]|nr:MAG: hypothetical protein DRQ36_03405 [bacterium]
MTPANLVANVISRSEATRNLLNDNDLRFLADGRNDKILYFAGLIRVYYKGGIMVKLHIYAVIVFALLFITTAWTAIPGNINYQGKLTDPDGVAIDGTRQVAFAIYNVSAGGSALWSETHPAVNIDHGLFDVILGSITSFPASLDFSEPYWLEITVAGETLTPRQPFTSAPYAFRALTADSVGSVNVDNVTIEINASDQLQVKALGITNSHIADGTIRFNKLSPFAGAEGQILKIVSGTVQWAADDTGSGGAGGDNDWAYSSGSGLAGDIYHTGNVAVGGASPTVPLDVDGAADFSTVVDIHGTLHMNNQTIDEVYQVNHNSGLFNLYNAGGGATTIQAAGNLSLGTGSASDDDYIYFDNGAEYIVWDNSPGEFDFSDDVSINGNLYFPVGLSTIDFPTEGMRISPNWGMSNDIAIGNTSWSASVAILDMSVWSGDAMRLWGHLNMDEHEIYSINYINFDATKGSSGYGIRDNAGTVEYKHSGGSWTAIGGGAGQWEDAGTYKRVIGNDAVRAYESGGTYGLYSSIEGTAAIYGGNANRTGYLGWNQPCVGHPLSWTDAGVYGYVSAGSNYDAVYGVCEGGGSGVIGVAYNAAYAAVRGYHQSTSAGAMGIYGQGYHGVFGTSRAAGGAGVYGDPGSGTYAGYFNGDVHIEDELTIDINDNGWHFGPPMGWSSEINFGSNIANANLQIGSSLTREGLITFGGAYWYDQTGVAGDPTAPPYDAGNVFGMYPTSTGIRWFDGASWSTISGGGGGIGGSGSANRLAIWSDASNLTYDTDLEWDAANSRLYFGSVEYMQDVGANEIGFNADLEPSSDAGYNLGNSDMAWNHLYLDGYIYLNGSTGTAGQVLTSNGAADPTWQDPAGGGLWTDAGSYIHANENSDVRVYDSGSSYDIYVYKQDGTDGIYVYTISSEHGPDETAIYGRRSGTSSIDNGGTGWTESGIDCGVKGYSYWGNKYTAGVAGFNYCDYDSSCGVIGGNNYGDYYGMLGYRDDFDTQSYYAGYFRCDSNVRPGYAVDAYSFGTSSKCAIRGQSENSGYYTGWFWHDAGSGNPGLGTNADFDCFGTKSAVVPTGSYGYRKMYCEEATEIWFTDYGSAKLSNGRCIVELDPVFLQTVTIDNNNPVKVFIQMTDECPNGVYVKKGKTTFEVIEQNGGNSSASFDYRIVAKRRGFETRRLTHIEEPNMAGRYHAIAEEPTPNAPDGIRYPEPPKIDYEKINRENLEKIRAKKAESTD